MKAQAEAVKCSLSELPEMKPYLLAGRGIPYRFGLPHSSGRPFPAISVSTYPAVKGWDSAVYAAVDPSFHLSSHPTHYDGNGRLLPDLQISIQGERAPHLIDNKWVLRSNDDNTKKP
jgi:hypothetical protein